MRLTGFVRKLDGLGRIVVPAPMRRMLNLTIDGLVEIHLENDGILLEKYTSCCTFCGGQDELLKVMENLVCAYCASDLVSLYQKTKKFRTS